jgi:O-antigen/teichoic acid export membrane protein
LNTANQRCSLHTAAGTLINISKNIFAAVESRFAHGAFWTLTGTLLTQGSALAGSILAARILGPAEFGELGMVRSTLLLLSIPAGAGLGMVATKYVAEHRAQDPQRAGKLIGLLLNLAVMLSCVVAVLALIFAEQLASGGIQAGQLSTPLKAGSLLVVLTTINSLQTGALNGFEAFRTTSRLSLYDALLNLILIPLGARYFGVTGAILGAVITAACGMGFKHLALRQTAQAAGVTIVHRGVRSELPVIWLFALPAIIAGLTTQPFEWLGRLMLTRQDGGFSELGLFTAAQACSQIVMFLPNQLTNPALPILSSLLAGRDLAGAARLVKLNLLLTLAASAAVALPLALAAHWLMLVYGFPAGANVLRVLLMASILTALSGFLRSLLVASGHMWWQTVHTLIWSGTLLAGWWMFSSHGALGLAISYFIAFLVVVATQSLSVRCAFRKLQAGPVAQP